MTLGPGAGSQSCSSPPLCLLRVHRRVFRTASAPPWGGTLCAWAAASGPGALRRRGFAPLIGDLVGGGPEETGVAEGRPPLLLSSELAVAGRGPRKATPCGRKAEVVKRGRHRPRPGRCCAFLDKALRNTSSASRSGNGTCLGSARTGPRARGLGVAPIPRGFAEEASLGGCHCGQGRAG